MDNELYHNCPNDYQMYHIHMVRILLPYMYIVFTLGNATFTDTYVIDPLKSSDEYMRLWIGWVLSQWNSETWNSAYARAEGLTLGLRLANERRRYKATPALIGWAQTWRQPWYNVPFGTRDTHSN